MGPLDLAAELADCVLAPGEAAPFSSGRTAASAAAVALYAAGSLAASCEAEPNDVAASRSATMVPGIRYNCSSHCCRQQELTGQTPVVEVEVVVVL